MNFRNPARVLVPMRRPLLALVAILSIASLHAQQAPTAADIMAKVAANQDKSEAERIHYLYIQHAHVISKKGNTVRCEETTDSRVVPASTGSHQELLKLDGRVLSKHNKYITYTRIPTPAQSGKPAPSSEQDDITVNLDDDETDRDLVENLRQNLTNTKSRDGIGAGLFPLTTKSQADYRFQLIATEHINGREVFHITFQPKDKSDFGWRGDAYIDTKAFQPVVVRTAMARNIPFAVRTLLGTSVPGLGFTVIYAPEPENDAAALWFPISFGTEFKIKVLFFFKRDITLNAENKNFEKTHVTSKIIPAADSPQP